MKLPVDLAKVRYLLLGNDWLEVAEGTLVPVRDDCDDPTEWLSFERPTERLVLRVFCRVEDVKGFKARIDPVGAGRCCEHDHDGDGNCHVHSSPGVLRATRTRQDLGSPWCDPCRSFHPVPRDESHKRALRCRA